MVLVSALGAKGNRGAAKVLLAANINVQMVPMRVLMRLF